MPAAEMPACVFCGEPIGPGEATAGRAPMAAHATCADAALADDSHWDAISTATGEPAEDRTQPTEEPTEAGVGRRAGCLGTIVLLIAVVTAVAIGLF